MAILKEDAIIVGIAIGAVWLLSKKIAAVLPTLPGAQTISNAIQSVANGDVGGWAFDLLHAQPNTTVPKTVNDARLYIAQNPNEFTPDAVQLARTQLTAAGIDWQSGMVGILSAIDSQDANYGNPWMIL